MITKFKIFEKFDVNETYLKLIKIEDWNKIRKSGFLIPNGIVKRGDKIYRGNWVIPESNIEKWLVPVKYFGSPLQALLMRPAKIEHKLALIKLNISSKNEIYNRDLSKMFINYSFKNYYGSFTKESEYEINESFITGKITDFELINTFKVPYDLSEWMAEPKSILNFIFKDSEIIYTDKKMIGVMSALFRVLAKKIFTLDFKNF